MLLWLVACRLLTLPTASPTTLLNVQLDTSRPTQLYRAPAAGGGPGAWIITAAAPAPVGPAGPHVSPVGTAGQHVSPVGPAGPHVSPVGTAGQHVSPVGTAGGAGGVQQHHNTPLKLHQAAGWYHKPPAGADVWTRHNIVETTTEAADVLRRPSGGAKPVRRPAVGSKFTLPSFVITSRPFGLGSSAMPGSGPRPASSPSGGHARPAAGGYGRPPVGGAAGEKAPASGSQLFQGGVPNRPPPTRRHSTRPRPPHGISAAPAVAQHQHGQTDSTQTRPSPASPSTSAGAAGHTRSPSPAAGQRRPSTASPDPAPAAAPPPITPGQPLSTADSHASVTHKTSADSVSSVAGHSLPTYQLGCRQGRRCSFIISAPARARQPTYTPYNRDAVDSYLARYQQLLAQARTPRPAEESEPARPANAERRHTAVTSHEEAPATQAPAESQAVAVAQPSRHRPSGSDGGAGRVRYSSAGAGAAHHASVTERRPLQQLAGGPVPSSASQWRRPLQQLTGGPVSYSTGRWRRPGTAELYRTLPRSALGLRSPAREAGRRGHHAASGLGSEKVITTHSAHRPLAQLKRTDARENGGTFSRNHQRTRQPNKHRPPNGKHWSRYSVERVHLPRTASNPVAWKPAANAQPTVNTIPASGRIFHVRLSTGPISLSPSIDRKRSRSYSGPSSLLVGDDTHTATIITADGVRTLPNLAAHS